MTHLFSWQAFPPGKHFEIPAMPNITAVNALGDFDIAADRLAIIDGEGSLFRARFICFPAQRLYLESGSLAASYTP
jgi:hypothetical protein